MAAANLEIPTGPRPYQPKRVTGADAEFLRELIVPKGGEVLTVLVYSSGGGLIPFRMSGKGKDGDAEDLELTESYAAGRTFVYSRDLGQQKRTDPALEPWTVLVSCGEDAATIETTVSYHRNA